MDEAGNKTKSPLDMTDEELQNAYRSNIERVQFSTNDYYREIERRTQEKHSQRMFHLTWAIAALTLIATIATIVSLWR